MMQLASHTFERRCIMVRERRLECDIIDLQAVEDVQRDSRHEPTSRLAPAVPRARATFAQFANIRRICA